LITKQATWINEDFIKGLMSVIIPVYNRDVFVKEAIESIHTQSYRPIECIVVDDGSTDNTIKTVKNLIDQNNDDTFKIKLIKQDNSGAPSARNNGIKNASGEFIQFLDSDDLLYPNKIKDQVSVFQKQAKIDGVYGNWHHCTIESNVLIKGEKWKDSIDQFYGGCVIHTLSFLFRRSFINTIGPWDESLKRNQEIDYFLRGALAGGNFEYLPKLTGLWREHEGERIVTSSGAISALAFHDKWITEFQRLNVFTKKRQKTAAQYLFWHAMELDKQHKSMAIIYLNKAFNLYPHIPEFNTYKMKILRRIAGDQLSLRCWYYFAKSKNID
jgi:glycosyltransferase involved in cell wall biosynthesis